MNIEIARLVETSSLSGTIRTEHMVRAKEDAHDREIANALAVASAWAYADIDTFARQMSRIGMPSESEVVSIASTIHELFVDVTAYLLQNDDGRFAILVFRGTGLHSTTAWLTDATARKEPFLGTGSVHGGFFRAAMTLWHYISPMLTCANLGGHICDNALDLKRKIKPITELSECTRADAEGNVSAARRPCGGRKPLEALYITGHSMGGALAVLAAALYQWYHQMDPQAYRNVLRGVYTYGQPMVGDAEFADRYQREFGQKLFRHIYQNDIVPRLPPITVGRFEHFGDEFRSGEAGWLYRSKKRSQTLTFLGANFVGLFALAQRQLAGIPALRWVPTPFSWADHEPLNYLHTSQEIGPGPELL